MDTIDLDFANRLLSKALPNGSCLESHLPKGRGGYALTKEDGVAHRFIWKTLKGPIPEGMLVCHKCDNPPCINVEHLFLGTPLDNMLDKVLKGRAKGGHSCADANKLVSYKMYYEMLKLRQQELSYREIGDKYRLSKHTIRRYLVGISTPTGEKKVEPIVRRKV